MIAHYKRDRPVLRDPHTVTALAFHLHRESNTFAFNAISRLHSCSVESK
jgi:hypothetical protein